MSRRSIESWGAGALSVVGIGLIVAAIARFLSDSRRSVEYVALAVPVIGILAWSAGRELRSLAFRLGAVSVGLAAPLAEVFSPNPGFGWFQITVVATALAVALAGPTALLLLRGGLPGWAPALGLALLLVVLVWIVVGGGGFGHDESAYVLKARAWVSGTPDTGWDIHRGIAQSLMAVPIVFLTDSEVVFRSLAAVLAVGTVLAVGWLGWWVWSARAGWVAASIFAVAPSFLRRGSEFLTDIPSTGLLVVVSGLLWRWGVGGESDRRYLFGATTLAALAFYIRYQAVVSLGLVAAAAVVVFWPRVKRTVGQLMSAAGLFVALLLPHLIWSAVVTGTPWGVITNTGEAGGRTFLGQGLVDYARDFPDLLAGHVGAVAIAAALIWFVVRIVAMLRSRRFEGIDRVTVYFVVPAFGQILILGLLVHGEPRFLFFPVALLAVAASVVADRIGSQLAPGWQRVLGYMAVIGFLGMLGFNGARMDRNAEVRAASTRILIDTARAVVEDAGGAGSCEIATSYGPQITWYSQCATKTFVQLERSGPAADHAYLVLFENGKRQPSGQDLERLLALTTGEPVRLIDEAGSIGDATIWRLRS